MNETQELPNNLTAKMISKFTSISLRRVYELLNTNPNHGGIPSFRVGAKTLLVERKEFLKWWEETIRKGKKTYAN